MTKKKPDLIKKNSRVGKISEDLGTVIILGFCISYHTKIEHILWYFVHISQFNLGQQTIFEIL